MCIRDRALLACQEADVIVFVVDGATGITDEDEEVARIVRRVDKPVFLIVNKKDDPANEQDGLWDFYALGVGEPRPLSCLLYTSALGARLEAEGRMLPRTVGPDPEFLNLDVYKRQEPDFTFDEADERTFGCLALAKRAGREHGTLPCAMNAANEVANEAFRRGLCGFLDIERSVGAVMDAWDNEEVQSVEQLLEVDRRAREMARAQLGVAL